MVHDHECTKQALAGKKQNEIRVDSTWRRREERVNAPAAPPPPGLPPALTCSTFRGAAAGRAVPERGAALSLGSPSLFGALARGGPGEPIYLNSRCFI